MKRYVDDAGRAYDPFYIPLRLRRALDPCRGDNWLRWIKDHQPRPVFRYGKSWVWEPRESFIPPRPLLWVVESFNWWEVPDPDGLPPVWHEFGRFLTKEAARDFCLAWRAKEEADLKSYRAQCAWKEVKHEQSN